MRMHRRCGRLLSFGLILSPVIAHAASPHQGVGEVIVDRLAYIGTPILLLGGYLAARMRRRRLGREQAPGTATHC
jgi:hypothetical protein